MMMVNMNMNMSEVYLLLADDVKGEPYITSRSTQAYGVQTCLAVIVF